MRRCSLLRAHLGKGCASSKESPGFSKMRTFENRGRSSKGGAHLRRGSPRARCRSCVKSSCHWSRPRWLIWNDARALPWLSAFIFAFSSVGTLRSFAAGRVSRVAFVRGPLWGRTQSRSAMGADSKDMARVKTKRAAPQIRHGSASARFTACRCTVVSYWYYPQSARVDQGQLFLRMRRRNRE